MRYEPFPYPLPEAALREFVHPAEWRLLGQAYRHDGEILAGNGYLAIRCQRGRWLDADFGQADAEFVSRFGKLPWGNFPAECEMWRPLAPLGRITGPGLWLNGKLAPSPVWRVGDVLVRLSLLALVARLPRVEVNWNEGILSPLWFRFSGGRGVIARDERLTIASREIFQPKTDVLTGELERRTKPLGPMQTLARGPNWNWPPADRTEDENGTTSFID